jgi:O-antigen/teichoic acid export membrane protein
MHARARNRLPRWHRRLIYALVAVLVVTGAAWLAVAYLAAPPGEPTPAPHPWAGGLLAAHGIAAYAALVVCALVGHGHLRKGWRFGSLRAVGVGLGASLLALALTGLVFYYVAAEEAIPLARWSHVAIGVALPILLYVHIRRGRRVAGQPPARAGAAHAPQQSVAPTAP